MIGIYYLLDKRKAYKSSKSVPLLADIRYPLNGHKEHFRFAIGITCNPKLFKDKRVRSAEPNAESKNALLERLKTIANRIYLDGINIGKLPCKEEFKSRIKNKLTYAEKEKTTLDHFEDYINGLKAKKKSPSFISAMKSLKQLLSDMNDKGVSIRFQDIDLLFEAKFRDTINAKENVKSPNTVSSYVKRLKMFMNWASDSNLHQNNLYRKFELKEETGEIVALTQPELDTIAKLELPSYKHIQHGGIRLTRDWLLIGCQTGLRFSDYSKLAVANPIEVEDGYDLHITTKKTGAKVVIPISNCLHEILKSYDFKVPLPSSNQKFNLGLKRIAEMAGIDKKISSHTGRKTFCTIQWLNKVPVPQIMKMSGHKTEKEFYKYVGVSLTENAAQVRNINPDFRISKTGTSLKVA